MLRVPRSSEPPLEAPVAPTAEAWTRMTPAERARAVDELVDSESQEEIDEREAMAEGDAHLERIGRPSAGPRRRPSRT